MVAITGANGLLGSFIVRHFIEQGISVIPLRRSTDSKIPDDLRNLSWRECDVTDPVSLSTALAEATCVIHTSAVVSFNPRKRSTMMDINVGGTKNVVDACLTLNISRLIHISSGAALGRKKEIRDIDETSDWIDNDLNTDYAESKYRAELEAWRGAEEGLAVSIINPSVILAPANWEKSSAQLFKYVWTEKRFYSSTAVNYVDVRDVADVVGVLYKNNHTGQRYIVNAGQIPIKELFQKMADRFQKRAPSIEVSSSLVGVLALLEEWRSRITGSEPLITRQTAKITKESFRFNNRKVVQQLGISFRDLNETLDWCCEHYRQAYTTIK